MAQRSLSLSNAPGDIPAIIAQCRQQFAQATNTPIEQVLPFSEQAMAVLTAYDWPGNVNELRSFLEYMCLQERVDIIDEADLPDLFRLESGQCLPDPQFVEIHTLPEGSFDLREELVMVEIKILAQALRMHNGNISDTARYLSMKRTTLQQKIKRFGLQ